ncbi:MAG: Gfo/Idh/MocA family oxidoreductase [SAR202 cluster bacterium]|nr:Gfo/Idh/MocA family oxidoreductase [SAR202 cluster bacterium]
MDQARIGVIGAGWWATQHHMPSLVGYDRAELTGIADVEAEKAKRASEFYEVKDRFEDHRELLASGIDGVVIAVQHAYHYQVAKDALDAGVHVLVEKPMTLKASEAWDLVERADRLGLHLMVGYTYQFTKHAEAARKIVQSGRIGELQFVSGIFTSMVESYLRGKPQEYASEFNFPITGPSEDTYSDPTVAGGGQGVLQVTHPMGMVMRVTGLKATQVFAFMESFDLDVDLVDTFSYRLENGAVGTMSSTGGVRPGQPSDQRIIYFGTKGQVRQDMINGRLDAHFHDGTTEEFTDLTKDELYPAHATSRALVDLILGDGDNRAPGEQGARVVEFLEAGYRSAETGAPVTVAKLH